eukprot:6178071-Pleurochrysis_carterae.AAC.1
MNTRKPTFQAPTHSQPLSLSRTHALAHTRHRRPRAQPRLSASAVGVEDLHRLAHLEVVHKRFEQHVERLL